MGKHPSPAGIQSAGKSQSSPVAQQTALGCPQGALASPQHESAWHWLWNEPSLVSQAEPRHSTALPACVTCWAGTACVLPGQDTAGLALSPWLCLPSASSFTAWPFTALHGGSDGQKGLAAGQVPAPCLLQEPGCTGQLLQRAAVSPSLNNTEKEARKI